MLFLAFLLFPFAQERLVIFGIPVYALEFLTILSGSAFLFGIWKGSIAVKRIPRGLLWGAGLLFGGAAISLLMNGVDREGLGALKSWILFPMLFAFLAYQGISTPSQKNAALLLWFVGISLVASATFLIPSLSTETYDGRLRSFFPSPNHLAMFLVPGAVIGSFLLSRCMKPLPKGGLTPNLFVIALMLSIVIGALLKTESLGGVVGFASAVAVLLASSSLQPHILRKSAPILFLCAVAIVGCIAFSVDWASLASGETRTSLGSRVMIWNTSLSLITEHPVAGIGMRNFEEAYLALQPFFPSYLEWAVPHPHNIVLAFWLFTGVVGLIGFLTLVILTVSSLLDRLSSGTDPEARRFHGLMLALLVALLVQGLVDTPYFRNDLSFFFWAIVALSAILSGDGKRGSDAS